MGAAVVSACWAVTRELAAQAANPRHDIMPADPKLTPPRGGQALLYDPPVSASARTTGGGVIEGPRAS